MEFMNSELTWQIQHGKTIISFLKYLNSQTKDLILKGGTALLLCYELDRFSEDIHLDSRSLEIDIEKFVSIFCKKNSYSYYIAKNTNVVKIFMIHYSVAGKPLKVEISFRRSIIPEDDYTNINGFTVYTLNSLCTQKSLAYNARDRIRDLYDLSFICKRWWDDISDTSKDFMRGVLQYKGLEQFDYLIQTQPDELINIKKLADDFLDMFNKLGLLYDEEEKNMLDITKLNLPSLNNDHKENSPQQNKSTNQDKDGSLNNVLPTFRPKF
jgi:predicted nucleotidyltransferase component of viral defense system